MLGSLQSGPLSIDFSHYAEYSCGVTEQEKLQSIFQNYDKLVALLLSDMLGSLDEISTVEIRSHIIRIVGTSTNEVDPEKISEEIPLTEMIAKAIIAYDTYLHRKC